MSTKRTRYRPVIIFTTLIGLVVALTVLSIHLYRNSRNAAQIISGDTSAQTRSLISSVGKIALLPENETPTIATVSDPKALENQPFFADAKVGDKVLIYPLARKAFLYDPKEKKIINITSIAIDSSSAGTTTN